jgi:hypothetical protein
MKRLGCLERIGQVQSLVFKEGLLEKPVTELPLRKLLVASSMRRLTILKP